MSSKPCSLGRAYFTLKDSPCVGVVGNVTKARTMPLLAATLSVSLPAITRMIVRDAISLDAFVITYGANICALRGPFSYVPLRGWALSPAPLLYFFNDLCLKRGVRDPRIAM